MAKERKSPKEKKQLEYTKDHFTFGWHSSRNFPQTWSRKKARVNRQHRRKSEEVLAEMKPGIAADDVELLADDLTAARFKKSVSRKRLHKVGTVTVGEKIRLKLEKRAAGAGRKTRSRQRDEHAAFESARAAAKTLSSLHGEELVSVVRRADLLCNSRSRSALKSVDGSKDPVDRALYFLYRLSYGSAFEVDALRQNPALDKAFGAWIGKAGRILEHDTSQRERELAKKQATWAQARS